MRLTVLALLLLTPCAAQTVGASPPDPFANPGDFPAGIAGQIMAGGAGYTLRNQTINTGLRNLVYICAGQSNFQDITPTLYTPTNSSVIDNFNIYDGASYAISGPLLGTYWTRNTSPQGPGNSCARVADQIISAGSFDRIILVPIAVGSSAVADWATGVLANRIGVTMRRLASRGMTPSTTGVTFMMTWGQGETDTQNATGQSAYTTALNAFISNAQAAGFSGRIFVNEESWIGGTTSAAVQAAQAAVVNHPTVWAGGNLDSLDATNRLSDNTHFNDTGAAAAATLMYNAIHASGAPF